MKCFYCGKEFEKGNRPDGLPNGMGFKSPDGSITNVCADCLIEAGNNVNNLKKKSSDDLAQVYTILISQENPTERLLSQPFINAVKKNKGGSVEFGFDFSKYIAAFVFKTRLNRDRCASAFEQLGVIHDTRDDTKIDKRYADLL